MRLLFIRHAEPDYDNDTLTSEGFLEAEALAEAYGHLEFEEAYASPLNRSLLTAQAFMKKHPDKKLTICPWLKEFCHPIETSEGPKGCPWDFLPSFAEKNPGLFLGADYLDDEVLRTGSIKQYYDEVTDSFDALLKNFGYCRNGYCYSVGQSSEETFVFFTHFGLMSVILSHLLNIPFTALSKSFICLPSGVTTLVSEEREKGIASFRLIQYGDLSHLSKAGLSPSFAGRFCEVFDSKDRH